MAELISLITDGGRIMRKILKIFLVLGVIALVCCLFLVIFAYAVFSPKSSSVSVQVDGLEGEIQIEYYSNFTKTWLSVYYCKGEEKSYLGELGLGSISLFRKGKYSMSVDGNTLLIRWPPDSSYAEENWFEKTFTLPLEGE